MILTQALYFLGRILVSSHPLYAVEAEARDLSTAERKQMRTEKSLPTLAALQDWLQQTRLSTAPNTPISKAIDYSLKRLAALTRYAATDDLPIDNTPLENGIRPIAMEKKNWLFAGSERAGQRAAAIQTLLSAPPSSTVSILLPG